MVSVAPTGMLAALLSKSLSSPSCPLCSRPELRELKLSFRWEPRHPSLYWILYHQQQSVIRDFCYNSGHWLVNKMDIPTLIDQLELNLHLPCIVQRRLKNQWVKFNKIPIDFQLENLLVNSFLLPSFQYKMSHVICKNNDNSQKYKSRKIMSHRTEASYFLPLNEILTKVPSLMSSFFVVLQSMNVLNVFG